MSFTKVFSLLLMCGGLLTACATTPPLSEKATSNASDLATSMLPPRTTVVNPVTLHQPIVELPRSKPGPLAQVNQQGSAPTTTTLSPTPPADYKIGDNEPVQLDFEQIDLRQLIEAIGDELGITTVIDPAIGDKVTIRTSKEKPLTRKDLWPLLQLLLADANVSLEKKGNVYHLKKTGPSLPSSIGTTATDLTRSTSPEVMQVIPLRFIAVDSALVVLKPLVEPQGRVISMPSLNVIGVIASPERLERVNKLLTIIDADPFLHRGLRLFRLTNAKATQVQTELDKIFKAVAGNLPPYIVIALERINAVLVVSPPNHDFREVEMWVNILDERTEEGGEQIFIYRVKHLEAKNLAATLSNVFKSDAKKDEVKSREEAQQPPLPGQPPIPVPKPVENLLAVSAELKVGVVADDNTNSLIIRASARDYRQLLETISALDKIPREVMVNVVIAEVTLSESNKFGVDWRAFFGDANRSFVGTNFDPPGVPSFDNTGSGALSGFVVHKVAGRLTAMLNMIATEGDVRILSRPSILVRNNQEAAINVGSNEPVITRLNTPAVTTTQYISNDVQYRDTGITLKVTPRINDDGIINMKIYQEVSKLGDPRTEQKLQSFLQRKVETSVVIRDGSAIVIGGLIETNSNRGRSGVPILQDLPIAGKFFSSSKDESTRTELVLIMVPEIVNPEANNELLIQRFRAQMHAVSELLNDLKESLLLPPGTEPPAVSKLSGQNRTTTSHTSGKSEKREK